VPTYDGAIHSLPDDGIVGSFDQSAEVQKRALGFFVLSDVADNHGGAYNHAASALDRRNSDRNVDGMAILADAYGLKSLDMLAAPQPPQVLNMLAEAVWRYEHRYRPPQNLLRFIPAHLFGALVPTYNNAVYISSDDGIVGGL